MEDPYPQGTVIRFKHGDRVLEGTVNAESIYVEEDNTVYVRVHVAEGDKMIAVHEGNIVK